MKEYSSVATEHWIYEIAGDDIWNASIVKGQFTLGNFANLQFQRKSLPVQDIVIEIMLGEKK